MKSITYVLIIIFLLATVVITFYFSWNKINLAYMNNIPLSATVIEETGSPDENSNKQFWLNSGGIFYLEKDHGFSIHGLLSPSSKWYKLYQKSNPSTTNNGAQPQNILRLITKQKYNNARQQVYIKILSYNASGATHLISNGIFLFNNYIDSNNLYISGIRVDGTSVIKKKVNGEYTTLAQQSLPPDFIYSYSESNELPYNSWIGLKTITNSNEKGTTITLYADFNQSGTWKEILTATDSPSSFKNTGSGGIRTDFMDIETKNYQYLEYK